MHQTNRITWTYTIEEPTSLYWSASWVGLLAYDGFLE
jgi:hypothetical protein